MNNPPTALVGLPEEPIGYRE